MGVLWDRTCGLTVSDTPSRAASKFTGAKFTVRSAGRADVAGDAALIIECEGVGLEPPPRVPVH